MRAKQIVVAAITIMAVSLGAWLLALSPSRAQPPSPNVIPGRYIVVVRAEASPADVARAHGLAPTHVYTAALNGFAAPVSDQALAALIADPRVLFVEPDQAVIAFAEVLPSGVDRIDADLNSNTSLGVGVAIIDTGIQLDHPDLKPVVNAKTCVLGTKFANDDNGHGTHVGGIVGARANNDIGVRGVAPGVTLYAVKVLNKNGSGFMSWVICGVDWVTKNADKIKVANLSLGAQGTSDALHAAIRSSVYAGVTYVVAAGNGNGTCGGGQDVLNSSTIPALYAEVITVTAFADTNGLMSGGGGTTATCGYADDTWAGFSNYGNKENDGINSGKVELGSPGVDILSTYKGSAYKTASGTSMAAPHVAGAAALHIKSHPGTTPAQVKQVLIQAAEGNPAVVADPRHPEPMVYAGTL